MLLVSFIIQRFLYFAIGKASCKLTSVANKLFPCREMGNRSTKYFVLFLSTFPNTIIRTGVIATALIRELIEPNTGAGLASTLIISYLFFLKALLVSFFFFFLSYSKDVDKKVIDILLISFPHPRLPALLTPFQFPLISQFYH